MAPPRSSPVLVVANPRHRRPRLARIAAAARRLEAHTGSLGGVLVVGESARGTRALAPLRAESDGFEGLARLVVGAEVRRCAHPAPRPQNSGRRPEIAPAASTRARRALALLGSRRAAARAADQPRAKGSSILAAKAGIQGA